MKPISQKQKAIMEDCKLRARDFGLDVPDGTLEYIVTNRQLIELSPKIMIPTLYDYWVQDVNVIQGHGRYKVQPSNPYESVINSSPNLSFYNDNNPDWLNLMIYYHVIGHIDFFRQNKMFSHTWDDDFVGQALADKRLIADLRKEHGRWVDYVIEFASGIDNLVGYYDVLSERSKVKEMDLSEKFNYYFNQFLRERASHSFYLRELERYNDVLESFGEKSSGLFFTPVQAKFPEFEAELKKHIEKRNGGINPKDLMEYLIENSPVLNKSENEWMKDVIQVIRNTSLYFQPQIRTKIFNEGWASYWHQKLFMSDSRIDEGHWIDFADIDSGVTSLRRSGINPYAIGLRLVQYAEEMADKGRLSFEFRSLKDATARREFDLKTGKGMEHIFKIRQELDDSELISRYVDQDFVDKHNLFVMGLRPNYDKGVMEHYVKSRSAEDYKEMLLGSLYHPPNVRFRATKDDGLLLIHNFEGKQLVEEQISNVLIGLEYLWGSRVKLVTNRLVNYGEEGGIQQIRTFYSCKGGEVNKHMMDNKKKDD